MWLVELLYVLMIFLLLSTMVKFSNFVVDWVSFKGELMIYHSYLAGNRLYQRYDGGYKELYDKHLYAYRNIKKFNNPSTNPYDISFTKHPHNRALEVDSRYFKDMRRNSLMEDYPPSSFTLAYTTHTGQKYVAAFYINRVGAIRKEYRFKKEPVWIKKY